MSLERQDQHLLEQRLRAEARLARRPAPASLRAGVRARLAERSSAAELDPVRRPAVDAWTRTAARVAVAAAAVLLIALGAREFRAAPPEAAVATEASVAPLATAAQLPTIRFVRPLPASLAEGLSRSSLNELLEGPLLAEANLLWADAERMASGMAAKLPAPLRWGREQRTREHADG